MTIIRSTIETKNGRSVGGRAAFRRWFRRSLTLWLLVLMTPSAAPVEVAGSRQPQPLQADFAELERVVLAELSDTNTPGAAIGIVIGDRLVFAKGFGTSNVETGAPVRPEMLFRLGSTTKMFTAAALVRLANEGKLKLEAPIGDYAKGLNPSIARITSLQLLSHTAGLKDNAVMFGKHDDAELGETVRALNQDSLFTEPGRVYSYANPGYWLAGYVIEQVSGRPYADELQESLFKPLGMTSTTLRPTMAMTWPLSQGHEGAAKEKPHVIRPFADNAGNWPAGSMFSSVNDLSRFAIAFMNGGRLEGNQVLSPSIVAALSTPQTEIPGSSNKYGLGLTLGDTRGVRVAQHGGSRSGFGSLIRMFPDKRIAIIILINRTGGTLNRTADKATELMLAQWAKEETKPTRQALTTAEMTRYVGVYGEGTNRVDIFIKAGNLFFKSGRIEGRIWRMGDSAFAVEQPREVASIAFGVVAGVDGRAEFLVIDQRAIKRSAKTAVKE